MFCQEGSCVVIYCLLLRYRCRSILYCVVPISYSAYSIYDKTMQTYFLAIVAVHFGYSLIFIGWFVVCFIYRVLHRCSCCNNNR